MPWHYYESNANYNGNVKKRRLNINGKTLQEICGEAEGNVSILAKNLIYSPKWNTLSLLPNYSVLSVSPLFLLRHRQDIAITFISS